MDAGVPFSAFAGCDARHRPPSSSPAPLHWATVKRTWGIIRGSLRIAFMRPTATKNVVSCQDIFYPLHDICYRLSVSRRNDLEAIIAFRATPNMNNASLIPMFGPLGKQQLATTLEASHLEFGMPIRCRPHCEPPSFRDDVSRRGAIAASQHAPMGVNKS